MTLVVSGESTAAADPSQRALDDPAFWEHDEPMAVAAAHDLEFPGAGAGDGGFHFPPLITRVADNALDEREAPSRLAEQGLRAVAILYARRMDVDGQQQAQRVGQDVALSAKHLLASIIPGRVERGPPLTAPLAV